MKNLQCNKREKTTTSLRSRQKIFDEICKEIFVPEHCLWDWYVVLLCDKIITGSFNLWWLNVREHSSCSHGYWIILGIFTVYLNSDDVIFYRHHHRWLVTPTAVADKMLQIFFIILGIIPSLFCTGQLYSFKTFEGSEVLIGRTVSTWQGEFFKLTPN